MRYTPGWPTKCTVLLMPGRPARGGATWPATVAGADMPTELWIFIIVLTLFLLGLVSYVIRQIAKAKKDFEKIDYSKIRRWKDDDW
jgi:hypothetical protein